VFFVKAINTINLINSIDYSAIEVINVQYKQIVKDVNAVLEAYTMKLTLRQIFYRLVAQLKIPNTVNAYKCLSRILVKARERGHVDDERIEDRSRQVLGYGDFGYDDPDDFIDTQIERLKTSWDRFDMPMWDDQERMVVIALEKDALSRLFTDIAEGFRVKVFPTRGYGSYTYVKKIAEECSASKPTTLLYFGDYDPSGRDIERDLGERGFRYGGTFMLDRRALTVDQIEQYKLPPRPEDTETLKKLERDPRSKTYGLQYAVELDALEPTLLQELVKKAITDNIDMEKWNARIKETGEKREKVKAKLEEVTVTFKHD
jgi:hypothetical protein